MPCPTPKLKLKAPAYQRGNSAGNSKKLQQTECLNSVVDDKSVFVRVAVCEIPLADICDTGSSISCLSPKVFVCLRPKIQSSLKPCSKRTLAANEGKNKVKGELAVELKVASMLFMKLLLSLKLLKLSACQVLTSLTHKCDPMFSEIGYDGTQVPPQKVSFEQQRFNPGTTQS